jgi:2,3-bisphosphoglycerate-independent phosphoglycerate mutase
MISLEQMKGLSRVSPSKIVLLVMDGLGGLPRPETGKTELEEAKTPNLDQLARKGVCGLIDPVSPGITPGSAPGHLALFGYDPLKFIIGRGILEAIGIGLELGEEDVAVRGNFCTLDQNGLLLNRRAGRIPTEVCSQLCQLLNNITLSGAELLVAPVREHRFVAIFRGEALSAELSDSDPQQVGQAPKSVVPLSPQAARMAEIANEFIAKAKETLAHSEPANMILLRGFSQLPQLPSLNEVYKLKPAAIAAYPMYRGLAKLVGMEILQTGNTIEEEFDTLTEHYQEYDFFYLHVKQTDSAGEDGDFERKFRIIEQVDALLPRLLALEPDVLIVTADHSTPALLKAHSWHPVPTLLYSKWCRLDDVHKFSERACARGSLGRLPALYVMPLAMAHALKLAKFGA